MKKVALLAGLAIGLAACGQSTPAAQQSLNVAGGWTGTLTINGKSDPLNMQLSQVAGSDDFTGIVYNDTTSLMVKGKVSTGIMTPADNVQADSTFTGTFTATTYKGVLTSGGGAAAFSFTKNQ